MRERLLVTVLPVLNVVVLLSSLLAGRLGDIYGYRRLFILGCGVYSLTSIAAGLSFYSKHTLIVLDTMRALQGLGPSLLLPNGLALLAREYQDRPPHQKHLAFSFFGGLAPSGFVIGALFSSLTAQKGHWPWSFYAMALTCATLAVASILIIPAADSPVPKMTLSETIIKLDIFGALIGILGLLLFNFAWNQAPLVGWQSDQAISTLVVGLFLLIVFLWYEKYMTDYPLLPWHTFSSKASFVLACIAGGWSSFGVWAYYYIQQGQVIENLSPLTMTARFSPASLSGMLAAIVTSQLMKRIPASIIMSLAMLAFLIGSILLATRPDHQIYWAQMFVATIITPWGMDMSFPAATMILSDAMPREHQGLAASLVTTFVNYSISIGLGIAGTVDSYTSHQGDNVQRGISSARWSGVALAAMALCVGLFYCLVELLESKRLPRKSYHGAETPESKPSSIV